MKIYKNSLGIICVEPDKGYLLKRGNDIFKKAYLGINDKPETFEQIIDENYIFAEEEEEIKPSSSDLSYIKNELIKLSKSKLAQYLNDNPLFSTVKHYEGRYYNVSEEKQLRLTSQLLLYQGNITLGISYELTWNDIGNVCEEWTFEELFALSNQINEYVKPLVKQQQEIEVAIKNATTKQELNEIKIVYGN